MEIKQQEAIRQIERNNEWWKEGYPVRAITLVLWGDSNDIEIRKFIYLQDAKFKITTALIAGAKVFKLFIHPPFDDISDDKILEYIEKQKKISDEATYKDTDEVISNAVEDFRKHKVNKNINEKNNINNEQPPELDDELDDLIMI